MLFPRETNWCVNAIVFWLNDRHSEGPIDRFLNRRLKVKAPLDDYQLPRLELARLAREDGDKQSDGQLVVIIRSDQRYADCFHDYCHRHSRNDRSIASWIGESFKPAASALRLSSTQCERGVAPVFLNC